MKKKLLSLCGLMLLAGCSRTPAPDLCPSCQDWTQYGDQHALVPPFHGPLPAVAPIFFEGRFISQFRLFADFDGDGNEDVALPLDVEPYDDRTAEFALYLKARDGLYDCVGTFGVSPAAFSIEHIKGKKPFSRIWSYGRGNANSGVLVSDKIENGRITDEICVDVFLEELSGALLFATENASVPIRRERSSYANGIMGWEPCRE